MANDYVVRFHNHFYQLSPPPLPGLRGGKVVVESRLDGSLAIRFAGRYLPYTEVGPESKQAPLRGAEGQAADSGKAIRLHSDTLGMDNNGLQNSNVFPVLNTHPLV